MKPTRIIGTPKMIPRQDGTGRLLLINTDVGYLTLLQLAEALGISKDGIRGRVDRFGWHSPKIFEELHTQYKEDSTGNDEWRKLSGRSRDKNLNKIPSPGKYDNLFSTQGCDNVML